MPAGDAARDRRDDRAAARCQPDQAKARAKRILAEREAEKSDVNWFAILIWLVMIGFIVIPMSRRPRAARKGGKRYRRGRGPVVLWGPGWGGGGSSGSSGADRPGVAAAVAAAGAAAAFRRRRRIVRRRRRVGGMVMARVP